jgi:hypothetical protein
MAAAKKRKVADENHVFQSKWTEEYFFVCVKDVAVCLVCNGKISCSKEYNIKRHYETFCNQVAYKVGQGKTNKPPSKVSYSTKKFIQKRSIMIRYYSACWLCSF